MASGLKLCPTGARVFNNGFGFNLAPPPEDPVELLGARLRYWELALELCETDFSTLKNALEGHGLFHWPDDGRYGPAPGGGPDGEEAALKRIESAVWRCRQMILDLNAELDKHPQIQKQRQAEEAKRREDQHYELLKQQADQARRDRLAAISI
jgi:hypothetical protein